jgi:hypothetical protein
MDRQGQENRTRPKHEERRERPHRAAKARPRSLRAPGVTPASCCWDSQLVFWPRGDLLSDRLHATLHATYRQFQIKKGGRSLPLLKAPPKKPKTASLQVRIEEEVRHKLDAYAEFIDSSPSYVVTEALKLLFKRDEEFKDWSTQQTNHNNNHESKGGKSLFETGKHA